MPVHIAALVAAAFLADPAMRDHVDEIIERFHSDITVHRDGWMTVTETISIRTAGRKLGRGLYREFLLRRTAPDGTSVTAGFEVVKASRDGKPETYHVQDHDVHKRVRIGKEGASLKPGVYTYTLVYRIDRQVKSFKDHDALYWNVTGIWWDFVINRLSATVTLPPDVPRRRITLRAEMGTAHERLADCTAAVDASGKGQFKAKRPLPRGEYLTIRVGFPRGFIEPPAKPRRRGPAGREEWELPKGASFLELALRASPDHRLVCFFQRARALTLGRELRAGITRYMMFDVKSGRTTKVSDLVPAPEGTTLSVQSGQVEFSSDGGGAIIHADARARGTTQSALAFRVDLKTLSAATVASGLLVGGTWAGKSVAAHSISADGGVDPVRIVPPDGGKPRELPIRGFVVAADPGGSFLLAYADPKDPARPVRLEQARQRWRLLVTDLKGKVLRDLGAVEDLMAWRGVMSPGGKYCALREHQPGNLLKTRIRVVATAGGGGKVLDDLGTPIRVTDAGEVIAKGRESALGGTDRGKGFLIRAWDAGGKTRGLFPKGSGVVDACVAGDRLYYARLTGTGTVTVTWQELASALAEAKP